MAIWHVRTEQIGSKHLKGINCPNCKQNSLYLHGYQNVVDIWLIPVFPFDTNMEVECEVCSTTYPYENYMGTYFAKEPKFSTPWWHFSGIIITVIFLLLLYIYDFILK